VDLILDSVVFMALSILGIFSHPNLVNIAPPLADFSRCGNQKSPVHGVPRRRTMTGLKHENVRQCAGLLRAAQARLA
jgi:hypothetical protein